MNTSELRSSRLLSWSDLPEEEIPSDALTTKKIKKISKILFGTGAGLGFAVCVIAGGFAATPLLIAASSIGAAAALGAIGTGIGIRYREPSPFCPVVRNEKRQAIAQQCYDKILPFSKLQEYQKENLLLYDEIQTLLRLEIENGYDYFIEKHGWEAAEFLDLENKSILKLKYLSKLSEMEHTDMTDITNTKESNFFGMTDTAIEQ